MWGGSCGVRNGCVVYQLSTLTLQPLFCLGGGKKRKTLQKTRVFLFMAPLKSLEKEGNAKKENSENEKSKGWRVRGNSANWSFYEVTIKFGIPYLLYGNGLSRPLRSCFGPLRSGFWSETGRIRFRRERFQTPTLDIE